MHMHLIEFENPSKIFMHSFVSKFHNLIYNKSAVNRY